MIILNFIFYAEYTVTLAGNHINLQAALDEM